MPTHWTYADCQPGDDLVQGDILQRTSELVSLMKGVHAHFCDEKYLAFLVLTQTCDLVQRPSCKAQHISLAVIRSFAALVPGLADGINQTEVPGMYEAESKTKVLELLSRILNQNEQSMGLFYLHPDGDAGIAEHAVAQLRVTISFRSDEHYETLRKARSGRLGEQFQSKLGWLTGNLYSRVATKDWSDTPADKSRVKGITDELLAPLQWVPRENLKVAREAQEDLSGLSAEDAAKVITKKHQPTKTREIVFGELRAAAAKRFGEDQVKIDGFIQDLKSNARLSDALKRL